MKTSAITTIYDQYVMPTYPKTPLALVKGNGSYVSDAEGNMYLDFFPGWSVSGIGHCHPRGLRRLCLCPAPALSRLVFVFLSLPPPPAFVGGGFPKKTRTHHSRADTG